MLEHFSKKSMNKTKEKPRETTERKGSPGTKSIHPPSKEKENVYLPLQHKIQEQSEILICAILGDDQRQDQGITSTDIYD